MADSVEPVAKKQRKDVAIRPRNRTPRIFIPYRTIGLVSSTPVPFTSMPLGRTTFQITTSVGRNLQTYDLRRGLQIVFISRPQTPGQITATLAHQKVVYAAWGGGFRDEPCGIWIFQRGHKMGELEIPIEGLKRVSQLLIFGGWIIGACESEIQVWKADTKEHFTTLRGYEEDEGGVYSGVVCHMPTYLNKVLVGRRDGSVELWNVNSGKLIYTIYPEDEDTGAVTAMQPSPALSLVGIGRANGDITIHDIRLDREIISLKGPSSIASISFRTDGLGAGQDGRKPGVMATCSADDGDVTFWDLNNGGKISGILRGAHNGPSTKSADIPGGVNKVEFLPGQPVLITSGHDNALKSWIFDETPFSSTPRPLHARMGHAAPATILSFIETNIQDDEDEGKWILSASKDRSLWAWSVRRDNQSTEISQGNIRRKAKSLGFDGKLSNSEQKVSLDDLKAPEITCMACCLSRDGGSRGGSGGAPVWSNTSKMAKDPDKPMEGWESIVTGHRGDAYARAWHFGSKKAGRWAMATSDKSEVKSVTISYCGNFAVIGSAAGGIDLFNLQSGLHRQKYPSAFKPAELKTLRGEGKTNADIAALATRDRHVRDITGLHVGNLSDRIYSVSLDGKIKIWNLLSGKMEHEIDWSRMCSLTASRFDRVSELLAISCDDLAIRIIDIQTRKLVRELWGAVGQIIDFCFSNDGRWIVAVSADAILRVWDLPTGNLIEAMQMESACSAITFSPTGQFLATAHPETNGVSLWTNKAVFKNAPTRAINEDEYTLSVVPTASGEGGGGLFAPIFEEERPEEIDEDEVPPPKMEQLEKGLLTLSLVPKAHWQSLPHLDLIRQRNKPIEPPKKPKAAPFFLPSLEPKAQQPQLTNGTDESTLVTPQERSRILAIQSRSTAGPTSALLSSAYSNKSDPLSHEPFIAYLKTLTPPATDLEIRTLSTLGDVNEQVAFVLCMTRRLRERKDFEVVQAWMAVFIKVHGEVAVQDPETRAALQEWLMVNERETKRFEEMLSFIVGSVDFLRSSR